ncbi:MAG: sigma-54-dependent Fis family transcriptional regulator [Deltaproteobacteria bacterium]|nr:sigma-54-dependent Fis family transcriptional regulator [Deltaproteobacteria bacterium]
MSPAHILMVDDEPQIPRLIAALLGDSYRVDEVNAASAALARIESGDYDLVLTDLLMPEMNGIELMRRVRLREPDLPFIVLTAQASVETAVQAMREGAFDYLRKTAGSDELRAAVDRAVAHGQLAREVRRLRAEVDQARGVEIVGQSQRLKALLALADRVAQSDASVLILGESGTGKELLARLIHRGGRRAAGPFVAFDCSALAPSLVESELFGHQRGAFTGADRSRRGLFREAHGGTLLLDEIGDVPPEIQTKLLRVLQEREVKPVGGDEVAKVDVRIVGATNKDLRQLVREGRFREDLYYRLAVFPLEVPPLRERREDIPALVAHFLGRRRGRPSRVSADAMARLAGYHWPGNIRELENVIERAAILCDGDEIRPHDLPPLEGARPSAMAAAATAMGEVPLGRPLKAVVADAARVVEKQAIADALRRCAGSASKAARLLGISRASFYNKLKAHGIDQ